LSQRNIVEWIVLVTSVVAIALVVGVLVVEGLQEQAPANPRVELLADQARPGEEGWIIPANISNAGDEAAEAVVIEASAEVGGETERSELELDFLPAGTTVEVAFAFSAQPDGEISVRLVGFRIP
jgi:uncharacterized protein (TIGR02588 family)